MIFWKRVGEFWTMLDACAPPWWASHPMRAFTMANIELAIPIVVFGDDAAATKNRLPCCIHMYAVTAESPAAESRIPLVAITMDSWYCGQVTERPLVEMMVWGLNQESQQVFGNEDSFIADSLNTPGRRVACGREIANGHFLVYLGGTGDWKWQRTLAH